MIQDPSVLDALRKALKEDKLPQVKTRCALAMALLQDMSSVDDLVDLLLNSQSDATKSFVSLSLGYMGDISIVKKLLDEIMDEQRDDLTRMHCIHVCTKLLSGWTKPYMERVAAGSNFACEYPMMSYLLDFGI